MATCKQGHQSCGRWFERNETRCNLSNDRWLKRPEILRREESEWPQSIKVLVLEEDDAAVRKELQIYAMVESRDILQEIIAYYSS